MIHKTEEQKTEIKEIILASFMFSNLVEKDLNIVINAMEVKYFQ